MASSPGMEAPKPSKSLEPQVSQATIDEASSGQDQGSTDCCVICLEPISDACEISACRHRCFDFPCLLSWVERSPRCPLCNCTISIVRHALDEPAPKIHVVAGPRPALNARPEPLQPEYWGPDDPMARIRLRARARHRSLRTRSPATVTPPEEAHNHAVARRREIYSRNLYSKHMGSNRFSQYRELTPALFCANPDIVSRARMWIRRELQVFTFLARDEGVDSMERPEQTRTRVARRRATNPEIILEYIIGVLKSVDIMGSGGQAEAMISDHLGRENTRLFLHELRTWLRSPYTKLEDWDRAVQYDDSTIAAARNQVDSEQAASVHVHSGLSRPLLPAGPELERYLASREYQQRREEYFATQQQRVQRQMTERLRLLQRRTGRLSTRVERLGGYGGN